MGKKLYVGNIPFTFTDAELRKTFEAVGTVADAKVITFRDSGRSKGFGFVEMGSEAEAESAIQQINDTEVGGRKILVAEARPKRED